MNKTQALLFIVLISLVSIKSQFSNPFLSGISPYSPINFQPNPLPNFIQPNNPQFNPANIYQNNPFLNHQYNTQYYQQNSPQNNQSEQKIDKNRPSFSDRVEQSSLVRPTSTHHTSSSTNQRVSERKCKEYQFVGLPRKNATFVGSLIINSNPQPIEQDECNTSQGLIVGGINAAAGEFPHMVAIGYKNLNNELSFDCGGSLISERFVLTAAHCRYAVRTEASVVRVGDLNLKLREPGLPELDVPILNFIPHEQYGASRKNDIAVIRLARDVEFNKFVRPACLMTKNSFPQNKAIASGWGFTDNYNTKRADHLQKVELPLIGYRACNNFYNGVYNYNLDRTQLCAGDEKGGKDTCRGDSGGPLQIISQETSCLFTIVGVASFGISYCGGANSPGIYTKVSAHIDWIEQKVWGS